MALIACPNCGKQISDKAKKCVHCGHNFDSINRCTECGNVIPHGSQECPTCGCPVTDNIRNTASVVKAQAVVQNKKPIVIAACIIILVVAVVFLVSQSGPNLNADEKLAYNNAVTMKKMMRDPDSFQLYDEMFLIKVKDDDGALLWTYTLFEYGGTNGYGAMSRDEAIFEDNTYVMDYADIDSIEEDARRDKANYQSEAEYYNSADAALTDKKYTARYHLAAFRLAELKEETEKYERVDIDVSRIKKKMKLK